MTLLLGRLENKFYQNGEIIESLDLMDKHSLYFSYLDSSYRVDRAQMLYSSLFDMPHKIIVIMMTVNLKRSEKNLFTYRENLV